MGGYVSTYEKTPDIKSEGYDFSSAETGTEENIQAPTNFDFGKKEVKQEVPEVLPEAKHESPKDMEKDQKEEKNYDLTAEQMEEVRERTRRTIDRAFRRALYKQNFELYDTIYEKWTFHNDKAEKRSHSSLEDDSETSHRHKIIKEAGERLATTRRSKELAEKKEKLLAERREKELAEQKERELAEKKEKELAEQKEKELAEQIEKELADKKEEELADSVKQTEKKSTLRQTKILKAEKESVTVKAADVVVDKEIRVKTKTTVNIRRHTMGPGDKHPAMAKPRNKAVADLIAPKPDKSKDRRRSENRLSSSSLVKKGKKTKEVVVEEDDDKENTAKAPASNSKKMPSRIQSPRRSTRGTPKASEKKLPRFTPLVKNIEIKTKDPASPDSFPVKNLHEDIFALSSPRRSIRKKNPTIRRTLG